MCIQPEDKVKAHRPFLFKGNSMETGDEVFYSDNSSHCS